MANINIKHSDKGFNMDHYYFYKNSSNNNSNNQKNFNDAFDFITRELHQTQPALQSGFIAGLCGSSVGLITNINTFKKILCKSNQSLISVNSLKMLAFGNGRIRSVLRPLVLHVPITATYFTVYNLIKRKYEVDGYCKDGICKKTFQFGAAASLAGLCAMMFGGPSFSLPLRYGIQFSIFEMTKIGLCYINNDCKNNPRQLNPFDIGVSALLGGGIASSIVFTSQRYINRRRNGYRKNPSIKKELVNTYKRALPSVAKFVPMATVTAIAFEFTMRRNSQNKQNKKIELI